MFRVMMDDFDLELAPRVTNSDFSTAPLPWDDPLVQNKHNKQGPHTRIFSLAQNQKVRVVP